MKNQCTSVILKSCLGFIIFSASQCMQYFSYQVISGLVSLSQKILGPNTILQGALPDILEKTPQSFYDNGVAIIQVCIILHLINSLNLQTNMQRLYASLTYCACKNHRV